MAPRQRFSRTSMDEQTTSVTAPPSSLLISSTSLSTTHRQQHDDDDDDIDLDDSDTHNNTNSNNNDQGMETQMLLSNTSSNSNTKTNKTSSANGKDRIKRYDVLLTTTKATTTDNITSNLTGDGSAATATAADRAREQHDFFNLLVLPFVVIATVLNWDLTKLLQGPEQAYLGKHFWLNWGTTLLYFVTDLLWVYNIPLSVKSPDLIIKHHIAAIAYLVCPIAFPDFAWIMGAMLTVEFNTWFLILRRVAFKRHDLVQPFLQHFIGFMFYTSWIIVRIIIYPGILLKFILMTPDFVNIQRDGFVWHWEFIVPFIHLTLVIMNLKWSYDLFKPFFVKSSTQTDNKKAVSDGL